MNEGLNESIKKEPESYQEANCRKRPIINRHRCYTDLDFIRLKALVRQKVLSGEYQYSCKRGRSKVWTVFSEVLDELGECIPDVVICKSCYNVYQFKSTTSNLIKHKCFQLGHGAAEEESALIDATTKNDILQKASEWMVTDCRSYKLLEDGGLKKLLTQFIELGAKFGANLKVDTVLPHTNTVAQMLTRAYDTQLIAIKNDISSSKATGYSLSTNVWSDKTGSSFLICSMHFLSNGALVNRQLGFKSLDSNNCTGELIMGTISEILEKFDCSLADEMPYIVTNEQAMLPADQGLPCFNHLLDNVVQKAAQAVPEFGELIAECRKLLEFCKTFDESLDVTLSWESQSRWNADYHLLTLIEENWAEITETLGEGEQHRLEGIDVGLLRAVSPILDDCEEASRKLEVSHQPTLHMCIPFAIKLKKMCTVESGDTIVVAQLKATLNELLFSEVLDKLSKIHRVALFLFPPTNKLLQFAASEKKATIDDCKAIMHQFHREDPLAELPIDIKGDSSLLFADFIDAGNDQYMDKVDIEIECYRNLKVAFNESFDCLQWWRAHQFDFPILYKTSCRILAIPATSAAAEALSAKARELLTSDGGGLAAEHINKCLFLHKNAPCPK